MRAGDDDRMSRTNAAQKDLIFAALSAERYAEARRLAVAAMRRGTADDMIRYLHTYAVERMGDLPRALREAADYLAAGRTEMRREYLRLRAAVAYRIGEPQAAAFYCDAYREEPADVGLYSSFLLAQNAREVDEGELFAAHCTYGALFADVPQYTFPSPRRHEKIRVGYISPDFRRNVMQNFIQPLLTAYDRAGFEVYVYSTATEPDDVTEALRSYADVWRDVGDAPAAETAARIRADEIDVLIDLAGHAAGGALPVLARRPAPVQMLGLGYTATSGLREVDAFLTDAVCDPPGAGHERYFTEELVRLPSQFCYVPPAHLPVSRETPARRRGYIVFGVFNQYRKFTDEMLSVWREILERVPASRLLLKSQVFFAGEMRAAAEERLRRLGFDLGRVLLEPADTGYMRRYLDVDIALDTFPWPGGGTTCDALYMGVPMVTRYAARRSTRFGCALLSHIGLAELAAMGTEDYTPHLRAISIRLTTCIEVCAG